MSHPHASRNPGSASSFVRVNGKIRAREVRVLGADGKQIGVLQLNEALQMARAQGLDLVEIAASANPPVCRIVDFGKFRYEQAKREKESKKHQHATKVKEVQLSPNIDPHDFGVKLEHGVDFLCEDMKVKVTLKFRGREMMHQEYGFQVVNRFLKEIAPWGSPDFQPKLLGRGINVMISPLPRNKRAKHPKGDQRPPLPPEPDVEVSDSDFDSDSDSEPTQTRSASSSPNPPAAAPSASSGGFTNNPFAALDQKLGP